MCHFIIIMLNLPVRYSTHNHEFFFCCFAACLTDLSKQCAADSFQRTIKLKPFCSKPSDLTISSMPPLSTTRSRANSQLDSFVSNPMMARSTSCDAEVRSTHE